MKHNVCVILSESIPHCRRGDTCQARPLVTHEWQQEVHISVLNERSMDSFTYAFLADQWQRAIIVTRIFFYISYMANIYVDFCGPKEKRQNNRFDVNLATCVKSYLKERATYHWWRLSLVNHLPHLKYRTPGFFPYILNTIWHVTFNILRCIPN